MRKVKNYDEISRSHIMAIRKRANLTQEQFAEKLNISVNTVSRIERGETSLTADVALRIREHFYVSMDYLFGFTQYEEGDPPCSASCDDLIEAQFLIDTQDKIIREQSDKLNAISRILNGKSIIKLTKNKSDGLK